VRKDLIAKTINIRNQVNSLEPMSRYREAMSQKNLKQRIQLMKWQFWV